MLLYLINLLLGSGQNPLYAGFILLVHLLQLGLQPKHLVLLLMELS